MLGFGPPATVIVIVVILLISGVKILREYERAVVFRLGRMVEPRGPGVTYVIPLVEKLLRVDLRTVTMDIPPQDVITRDNVSVKVNAVLYFRVLDPNKAWSRFGIFCLPPRQLPRTRCGGCAVKAGWTTSLLSGGRLTTNFRKIFILRTVPWA